MTIPQPVPPSWKDLGKSSNDLLQKDYPFNGGSLEVKTNTPSGVSFKVNGNRPSNSDLIVGDIEGKWSDIKHGLTITQTWSTSNTLSTKVEIENQIAKGLKVDLNTSLLPEKGTKAISLATAYKQSGVHTRGLLEFIKSPTFTADTVLARDGFLVGAEAAYDINDGKLTRYAAALGYNAPEYAITLQATKNFSSFSTSYYHRVHQDVEAGAKAVYDTNATHGGVAIEVGTKVALDRASSFKAKINNVGVIGLSYSQQLRPGVKTIFGLALDTTKLNNSSPIGPSHKVGLQMFFES